MIYNNFGSSRQQEIMPSPVYPPINKKSLRKASTQRGEFVGMKKARRGVSTESGG
jgi:hypothetical protein